MINYYFDAVVVCMRALFALFVVAVVRRDPGVVGRAHELDGSVTWFEPAVRCLCCLFYLLCVKMRASWSSYLLAPMQFSFSSLIGAKLCMDVVAWVAACAMMLF